MAANLQPDDPHRLAMTEEAFERLVDGEDLPRYELIDGIAYDMTGLSPEHGHIVDSISTLISSHIGRKSPCKVYQDQYVTLRTGGTPRRLLAHHQNELRGNRGTYPQSRGACHSPNYCTVVQILLYVAVFAYTMQWLSSQVAVVSGTTR